MVSRSALVILVVLALSAVAEAKNYRKYNTPTWGNRWKQTLIVKEVRVHPFIGAR
jgi:hypothetical protein